jgi:hypothetical protein
MAADGQLVVKIPRPTKLVTWGGDVVREDRPPPDVSWVEMEKVRR